MTDDLPQGPLIEAVEVADQVVVTLRGELDLTNVGDLERAVILCLQRGDITTLVFDMSDLVFMDSSVIAVLLMAAAAKRVSLRHPNELIWQVITATGLEGVLPREP